MFGHRRKHSWCLVRKIFEENKRYAKQDLLERLDIVDRKITVRKSRDKTKGKLFHRPSFFITHFDLKCASQLAYITCTRLFSKNVDERTLSTSTQKHNNSNHMNNLAIVSYLTIRISNIKIKIQFF